MCGDPQREFLIAATAPGACDLYGGFAPEQQRRGFGPGGQFGDDLLRCVVHIAGQGIADDPCVKADGVRFVQHRFERQAVRSDKRVRDLWQRQRCDVLCPFQMGANRFRCHVPDRGTLEHLDSVGRRADGADRGARGDGAQIVADHVGQDKGMDRGGGCKAGKSAALEQAHLLAHKVHLHDVKPGREQERVEPRLVGQADAGWRCRKQGRSAARDQGDDAVLVCRLGQEVHHAMCCTRARVVGNRVSGAHHFGPLKPRVVLVVGDGKGCVGIGKRGHGFAKHRRGGFADGDQKRPPVRVLRGQLCLGQATLHGLCGISRLYGGVEQQTRLSAKRINLGHVRISPVTAWKVKRLRAGLHVSRSHI